MNIYIQTNIRGPRKQDGIAGFVLEDEKGRTFTQFGRLQGVSENEANVKTLRMALSKIKNPESLDFSLWIDNLYLSNALTKGWVQKWKENGWMTTKKEPVANRDDWQKMAEILKWDGIEVHLKEHNPFKNWLVNECERREKKYV